MRATVCQDFPGGILVVSVTQRHYHSLFPHKLSLQRSPECLDALLWAPCLPGLALEGGTASQWFESVVGGRKGGAEEGEGREEEGGRKGERGSRKKGRERGHKIQDTQLNVNVRNNKYFLFYYLFLRHIYGFI